MSSIAQSKSRWGRHCVVALALAVSLVGCESSRSARDTPATDTPEPTVDTAPVAMGAGTASPDQRPGGLQAAPSRAHVAEIYRGAGFTLAAADGDAAADGGDGGITLNFLNADIREVIDAILGDMLRLSYVIDPRVQGTVTVRTSRPLRSEDVIPVLEDILAMNGAALIRSAEAFRVVPSDQATGFRMQQGFGVHIIPLQYAAAAAVRSAIESFVPPGRTVRIDAARNLLIFTGTGAEARDLEKLIEVFDVDWMTGMSFAIFTLQTAEAKRITQELEQVFGESFDGPLSEIVQFVPIERLNSILVITPQAAYLDKAAAWIERLDRGGEGVDQRIYVYLVQNGRAKDIAAVLDEVFGAGRAKGGLLDAGALAPGLAPIELTDYRRSPTPELRNSTERAAAAAAEDADGASADEIAAEPAVVSATEGAVGEGIAVGAEEGIRIVADERNNALVIRATPAQFRMVQAALRQLDLVPLQVLIDHRQRVVGIEVGCSGSSSMATSHFRSVRPPP